MIKQETFYAVACDRCGEIHEGGDYSFFSDEDTAIEDAVADDWIEKEDSKHYCPGCYTQDEDTDEITIKPPFPERLITLRNFIKKILKCPDSLAEKEDCFTVSFWLRVSSIRVEINSLKPYEENYIRDLLGDNLVFLEYRRSNQSIRSLNSECVITVKK